LHSGDDRDELRGGGRVGKLRAGRAFPSSFQSDARRIYDSLVELSARLASIMRPCRECCRELARALALSAWLVDGDDRLQIDVAAAAASTGLVLPPTHLLPRPALSRSVDRRPSPRAYKSRPELYILSVGRPAGESL